MILRGACHCGQVEVAFETAMSVADLPLRACGCSFCRRHGTQGRGGSERPAVDFRSAQRT